LSTYNFVVWDWNGTLVNDAWLCLHIVNNLLARYEKPTISQEKYENTFSFPVEKYYEKIGFNFSEIPFKQLGTEWMDAYKDSWQECALHDGAAGVIQTLRSNNINQAVVSAMDVELLHQCVRHYGILGNFLALRGLDHHYADGKEEVAAKFVSSFELDPQKILFIGDTLHDVQVAERVGADCVLYYSGHQSKKRLEQSGKRILGDLTEIYELLDV